MSASQFVPKVGVFDSWHLKFKWRKKILAGLPSMRSLENLYALYTAVKRWKNLLASQAYTGFITSKLRAQIIRI